jgi:hypothetical protein
LPPAATVNCSLIEGTQRDNTEDWIVPRTAVPTIAELEARIDEALVIARASEEGVREVGEMAIEAAREAKRAADAAEAAVARAAEPEPAPEPPMAVIETESEVDEPEPRFEVRFRRFSERADRLSGRLRRLGAPAASVGGGRTRGDG